jgi:hypothetical protein
MVGYQIHSRPKAFAQFATRLLFDRFALAPTHNAQMSNGSTAGSGTDAVEAAAG